MLVVEAHKRGGLSDEYMLTEVQMAVNNEQLSKLCNSTPAILTALYKGDILHRKVKQ